MNALKTRHGAAIHGEDAMKALTHVLVVEDDEATRLGYSTSLSASECKVEAVPDGSEALREMERRPFDVVMLDLPAPGAQGLGLLKAIKEKWPESEVVAITGYPSIETAKDAVRLGAYDYLAKPVPLADVIRAANGAMVHKTWALHRNRPNLNARA